eukprot:158514-Pyramimonas_sp.AAC.1
MEKLAANGFLTQFLARQAAAGGKGPRVVTARDLESQGIELQRTKKVKHDGRGGSRANIKFAREQ